MQIGRRFYLPLRSWRENHEDPAGNFGELNSFDRLVSTGCPNKKYKYNSFVQKFMTKLGKQKKFISPGGIFNDITKKSKL